MGSNVSALVKKTRISRNVGDLLNVNDLPREHVHIINPPAGSHLRLSVCRCWRSAKFPICDNAHQQLQKQGIECGPVMLEARRDVSDNRT